MTKKQTRVPPKRPANLQHTSPAGRRKTALSVDWDLYHSLLEESDASDEDKQELLETLFAIVLGFVDLGFGIHPLQQCSGDVSSSACEQNDELRRFIAAEMVELEELVPLKNTRSTNTKIKKPEKELEGGTQI